MMGIRVAVAGAGGRMGREVVKMVLGEPDFTLACAVSPSHGGVDAGVLVGLSPCGVCVEAVLERALWRTTADVLVDFTIPDVAQAHAAIALQHGVHAVVGTTGLSEEHMHALDTMARERNVGCLIAPNFSLGVLIMMRCAREAARWFPHIEIIEAHGDQKRDAPSGTALKTARMIRDVRAVRKQGHPLEAEHLAGARGADIDGMRVHSVRLPGIFAQQEVLFGAPGESLRIRHDSYDRAAYMPGVALAIRHIPQRVGVVYGFEQCIDWDAPPDERKGR